MAATVRPQAVPLLQRQAYLFFDFLALCFSDLDVFATGGLTTNEATRGGLALGNMSQSSIFKTCPKKNLTTATAPRCS